MLKNELVAEFKAPVCVSPVFEHEGEPTCFVALTGADAARVAGGPADGFLICSVHGSADNVVPYEVLDSAAEASAFVEREYAECIQLFGGGHA